MGCNHNVFLLCRGNVRDYDEAEVGILRESSNSLKALAALHNGSRTQLLMYNGMPGHGPLPKVKRARLDELIKLGMVSPLAFLLAWLFLTICAC